MSTADTQFSSDKNSCLIKDGDDIFKKFFCDPLDIQICNGRLNTEHPTTNK